MAFTLIHKSTSSEKKNKKQRLQPIFHPLPPDVSYFYYQKCLSN